MQRTLEAIFHRLIPLLILLILLPLMSLFIAYLLPATYQTTARFWAWHTFPSISAATQSSSAANPEIDPQTNVPITPAQSQANALSQFLQTYDFAIAITKGTTLASTLGLSADNLANPQRRNAAIYQEISHHVQIVAQGHNLVSVSYTSRNSQVSQQVVKAVIQLYGSQSQSFVLTEGQKLLAAYQQQLAKAQVNSDKVVKAEAQYRLNHPGLSEDGLLADSQYQSLHDQVQQEQTFITSIQTSIATLNQTISQNASPAGLFNVLDAPATQPVSRTTTFLIAGIVGLSMALLGCVVYIFIVVRRDRTVVYTAYDLQKVTTFPVVTQLPHLSPHAVPLLFNGAVLHGNRGR